MLRLYSQFGLVIAPERYFLGSASLPRFDLIFNAPCLKLGGKLDLYMAQAGAGTDHSHWHEDCPISKAASSIPGIRLCFCICLLAPSGALVFIMVY